MSTKIISRVYVFIALFFLPLAAHAAIVTCGPNGQGTEPCTITDFFKLFVNIFNYLLGMGAIVAFIFLIYGGIRMFLYTVDEENLAAGKKTIIEALIGLAIILLAYVLVNTLLVALGVTSPSEYFNGSKTQVGSGQ